MKFLTLFALCALSQTALARSIGIAEDSSTRGIYPRQLFATTPEGKANWKKFNGFTQNMWDPSKYEKSFSAIRNFPFAINIDVKKPKATRDTELEERQTTIGNRQGFGMWTATGFSTASWGWWQRFAQTECPKDQLGPGDHYMAGHITKTVVELDGNGEASWKWWWNGTSKVVKQANPSASPICTLPNFNNKAQGTQCVDKIWIANTKKWEPRSLYNQAIGWSVGNSSYNNNMVRTIYDCMLDRVAVEYMSEVPAFGATPVQYEIEGMKYYRFYDSNNFAWFVACPSRGTLAGTLGRTSRWWKRQGLGRNSNPIWDFSLPDQRDPRADTTPFPTNKIPNFMSNSSYVAVYWPEYNQQTIVVYNDVCQYMAVSRPGLRHWTARLVTIPPAIYPQITDEIKYPAGWVGYDKFHASWEQNDEAQDIPW